MSSCSSLPKRSLCSSIVYEMRKSITKTSAASLRSLDRFYRSQISPYVNRVRTLMVDALAFTHIYACVLSVSVCACPCTCCVCVCVCCICTYVYVCVCVIGPRIRYIPIDVDKAAWSSDEKSRALTKICLHDLIISRTQHLWQLMLCV